MQHLFPPGTQVRKGGLNTIFCYLGYNARTRRHELACVGQKTDATADELRRA